jgi:hypothetical protein
MKTVGTKYTLCRAVAIGKRFPQKSAKALKKHHPHVLVVVGREKVGNKYGVWKRGGRGKGWRGLARKQDGPMIKISDNEFPDWPTANPEGRTFAMDGTKAHRKVWVAVWLRRGWTALTCEKRKLFLGPGVDNKKNPKTARGTSGWVGSEGMPMSVCSAPLSFGG